MYNLFVSADDEAWGGEPYEIELSRCIREYTAPEITEQFGELDNKAISSLKLLPCIFAHESSCKKSPKFGLITKVTRRQKLVRIEYELKKVDSFLSDSDLENLKFDLDIRQWELNRSHWAVKNINLIKELKEKNIDLPIWVNEMSKTVDITSHIFDVGLSFPGEARTMVEPIAIRLEADLGPHTYFYDNNYVAQLARPSLDLLLQDIYRIRSKLIVIFLSGDYQRKEWCGIEFRAIREILMERTHDRIMFVKMDDGEVDGVFKTDGYVDGRKYSPDQIAKFIQERISLFDK